VRRLLIRHSGEGQNLIVICLPVRQLFNGLDSRLGLLLRSNAYMAQASFSTASRSHLLHVGVRENDDIQEPVVPAKAGTQ